MEKQEDIKPIRKIAGLLDITICLLLFISSLYKGGFYKEDSLFINMVICMLGLVCLSVKLVVNITNNKKVKKSKTSTIIDILVMLMPVAYFMPVLFGTYASKENAIFECTRYVNFAIIYFIARTTKNKKIYLTSIVLIGMILAVLGIDELTYRFLEEGLNTISINYLSVRSGKLSSTLQYANMTALIMLISSIIMQSKIMYNLSKFYEHKKYRAKVILELFGLIVLDTAIILTNSRMNILLMVISSIVYAIYLFKQKEKKQAVAILLMVIAAFALITSIDSYLVKQNYFMVIVTYIITLILIAIGVFVSYKFKVEERVRSTKNSTKNTNTKSKLNKIKIVAIVISLVGFVYLLQLPTSLKLKDDTSLGNIVARNVHTDFAEEMEVEITLDIDENDVIRFEIFEFDEEYNKSRVLSISQKDIKDGRYTGTLKLQENIKKLQVDFKVLNSEVDIKEFKLNGEKITLSYMFLPDSIIFRLKDTLTNDSNNTLRYTYYKDALKLFNESKLFGIGGEGFKSRYQEVQNTGYISSETHSVPMQILVEAGLFGIAIYLTIIILLILTIYRIFKNNKSQGIIYLLISGVFIITSLFDIVFSYGIMIYLFAIILGLVVSEYKKDYIIKQDAYELDNKSMLSMAKIAALSISLMSLFIVTIYSLNIYRSSMLILPEKTGNLSDSYERVGILENKLELDKYNATYIINLITEYDTHIDMLNDIYLNTSDEQERYVLKVEIDNYIVRQKELADYIIEYEYYNKYALEKVARCYFKNYLSYARIFSNNFKNDEIAYVFYIGYAIKITERIRDVGPNNALAQSFAYNIYSEYISDIQIQNKILGSDMLNQALQDMINNFEEIKPKVNN